MKRSVTHQSRVVAFLAALLALIGSVTLTPLPAQALEVASSSGNCIANVDNTTGVTSYFDGTYCYVAFKNAGTTYSWTRPGGVTTFDFVAVGGGGGGATRHAGGGGAGGLIQETGVTITATTISIGVGAGGPGAAARSDGNPGGGTNGGSSTITASGITTRNAVGGGAGQGSAVGSNGGSGGGNGCCVGSTVSSGTTGQGNSGSAGTYGGSYWLGGGGGGAGAAATAANGSTLKAGIGGAGASVSWINQTVQTALAVGVWTSGATYFAGGGGGGTAGTSTTGGEGGIGGGGAGATLAGTPVAGSANTGGGGGASGINGDNTTAAGAAGGSGAVVFRYAKQAPVISWNASDVNSYEETVSTTAINDLAPGSTYDGTLYSGSNSVAPGFNRTTGAWTFSGGATSTGPYAKVTTSISTTQFNTNGITVDFEADFGTTANLWERAIDFSSNADMANNLLIARSGSTNDLAVEIYNGNTTAGQCIYTGAIPTNAGMNRWTVSLDGANCRIYKNGTLAYTVAYTGKPSSGVTWINNYIGRSNWSNDASLEGSVRSLRIFAGGLSASEIPAPVSKTVTLNAYDGNAQNGGGVTNNMQSPRLTTGSVRLPTPITRAGYTFTGWYDATTFANKVGDAGGIYTPSSTITLYGGWRTSIDSGVLSNLVLNFDATHIDSLPVAATSAASIYPATYRPLASTVTGITRDTANSPGAASFPNGTGSNYISFGANNSTNITGAITFESWIKCTAYNSVWNIIASHWFSDTAGTQSMDWHFAIQGGKLQLNTGTNSDVTIGSKTWSASDCNGTAWHLVGFTIDSSNNAQLYIDGKPDGAAVANRPHNPNSSSLLWIGDGRTGSSRFQGYQSRVRLYNTALTATQMRANFSGEAVTYGMGPYTVTYAAGPNGTGSNVVETYNAATLATLKNNTAPFTRAGYYISGWTTSSTSGAAQTNALTSSYSVDANVTFYPVWTATTYTITYNYNGATGGNATASSTYAAGGTAITLPTPTRTSYTFGGWWTTSTFDTGTQQTGTQTPSSDYTLYAKWTLVQYTLTFKANDGLSTADITQTVNAGVAVNLRTNTFTKAHSAFGRWSDLASGFSLNSWTDGQSITPTSNMTFYAIWNDDAHIIFNSLGGSAVADAYTIGQPLAGATALAKPADPTKSGKIFGGWSTQYSGTTGIAINVVSWPRDYEMNANETLYAIWLDACAPTRTTFIGTGTSDLTSATYGTSGVTYVQYRYNTVGQCAFTVPSEVSALDVLLVGGGGGGSFYGRAGGGGAGTLLHTSTPLSVSAGSIFPLTVAAGGSFVFSSTDGSRGNSGGWSSFGNILAQGGGGGAGGQLTIQSAQPGGSGGGGACSAGYTSGGAGGTPIITGWSAYAGSGGNATYADCSTSGGAGGGGAGGSVANGTSTGGASLTRYGIELAGGGGAWWPSQVRQGGGNVGGDWNNTGCSAGMTSNDGVANTGSGGGSCGSGASGTVVVRFAAPTYTVTYNYDGATGGNGTSSANYVTSALTLPTPTKTGYTFGGWYAEAGLTTLVGNGGATYTPTNDLTLYAKWTGGTYTLTYNYNGATGGNATTSASYTTGGTAITLPTPTKTNYTFGGWYSDAGLTTQVTGTQTPSANATLYAKWNSNTFTLTYNYNGATGGNTTVSDTYTTGGTAITLPTPTKTGYFFDSWCDDVALTSCLIVGAQTPTADATLYAKWTIGNYTYSYNYNGATSGNSISSQTYYTGNQAFTMPAPSKTGYTFAGWYKEVGFVNLVSGPQTPSESFSLYAKWTAATFTLTYNYNGATGGNTTASASYTTGGSTITLPTPTKTGYTFAGWFNDSVFTTRLIGPLSPSADATLYAKWTAINYTLTYSSTQSNSGIVPTDSTNYNIGNVATVMANTGSLVRTGYTFAGWTVASDGSGTVLSSGQTVTFGSANITLYAKWTASTYAISYNVNGANGSQANTSDSYTTGGAAVTLSAIGTMAKTGYNFAGWSTTPTGSVIAGTFTTSADVTLYAIWTIKSIAVTYSKGAAASATFISFPANTSGNYGTRVTISNNIDSSVTFSSSTYAFVGWSDGTSLYQSGEQYLLGDTAVTLTAVWVQAFGVRYIPNGGTFANGTSTIDAECLVVGNLCTNGQVVTANAAPTRAGYIFSGWTDQSGNAVTAGGTFTVNINSYLLYAGWTPVNYTITYSPNGGATTPTQGSLHYGDTFTLAAAITRTGYTFNGWSDGTTTYGAGTTYSVGTSNVSLTAQWTPLTYAITYDWNGGTGSATANASYTVGNSGLTLPTVGDHVKDGFNFGGWSTTIGGNAVSTPYQPTTSGTLYAIWGSGSYTLTFNQNYGMQANGTATVANGQSTQLPTPSRSNFVFDGWYTASTGGTKVGNGGANFTPGGSSTLYARWIQASLYGVVGNLNRISTITASDSVSSSYSGTAGGSSVSVTLPSASLPAGTVVALDVITDTTYAQSLLTGTNNYILSIAVSWLAPDETVPNTNAGKAVSMTITNSSIKAGALVYSIQNGVVTLLGTATQNGTITVQLTSDPSVYVVATVPTAPQTIASTNTSTSATVTWTAPSSDGGATITGYTVTLNTGAVCTTTLLTCTFNNLTSGTAYTATVIANNSVGSSVSGTVTFTPAAQQSPAPSTPVTPAPPVTPVPPVTPKPPVTPEPPAAAVPIAITIPTAVEKVLAHNVPVLAGTAVISPILFGADSAKLDKADLAQIKAAAQILKEKSGWVYITGFVKSAGRPAAVEKKIATARAKAVAILLSKLGLKVKIGFLGYGPHNTKSPSAKDRKVEVRWVDEVKTSI